MDEESELLSSIEWINNLSDGSTSHAMEAMCLGGIKILNAQKGFIRCKFTVPSCLSDENGNWQAGAIATLIDDVGAAAICSVVGHIKASVDFSISYFSTAKIQDEVEISAKVIGHEGKLSSVLIEVRKSDNGVLIALAKQWMASHNNARL